METVRPRAGSTARVAFALLGALSFVLVPSGQASAGDDGGVHAFFSEQSGTNSASPARPAFEQAAPAPALTIRRVAKPRTARVERPVRHPRVFVVNYTPPNVELPKPAKAQEESSRPKVVSIMEDTTLRRGDAVMMKDGLRIFLGSNTFPYQDADFRAVGDGSGISAQYRKALVDIAALPPSAG